MTVLKVHPSIARLKREKTKKFNTAIRFQLDRFEMQTEAMTLSEYSTVTFFSYLTFVCACVDALSDARDEPKNKLVDRLLEDFPREIALYFGVSEFELTGEDMAVRLLCPTELFRYLHFLSYNFCEFDKIVTLCEEMKAYLLLITCEKGASFTDENKVVVQYFTRLYAQYLLPKINRILNSSAPVALVYPLSTREIS